MCTATRLLGLLRLGQGGLVVAGSARVVALDLQLRRLLEIGCAAGVLRRVRRLRAGRVSWAPAWACRSDLGSPSSWPWPSASRSCPPSPCLRRVLRPRRVARLVVAIAAPVGQREHPGPREDHQRDEAHDQRRRTAPRRRRRYGAPSARRAAPPTTAGDRRVVRTVRPTTAGRLVGAGRLARSRSVAGGRRRGSQAEPAAPFERPGRRSRLGLERAVELRRRTRPRSASGRRDPWRVRVRARRQPRATAQGRARRPAGPCPRRERGPARRSARPRTAAIRSAARRRRRPARSGRTRSWPAHPWPARATGRRRCRAPGRSPSAGPPRPRGRSRSRPPRAARGRRAAGCPA